MRSMHNPDSTLENSFDALLAQLDTGGRDFERLAGWFLVNDPEYAAIFERVWAWNDWPGCWGPDKGIDLIGRTSDGRIVAIQAKNYAERYSITKHDVDTFLSESARAEIDERLLIATTDRVAPTAIEVMEGQEKKVSRCLRTRLADARLQWPVSPAELLSGGREPQKNPRPHQDEAIARIREELGARDRAQVVMACGTGKTLVAVRSADALESELTLVLVPTLALLRQTSQDWAADAANPSHVLKVCSDTTTSEDDQPAIIDTADLGPGVTTDPVAIRAFLNSTGHRLVISTYKSSPQIAAAMAEDCDAVFDLAVCDEAHWCAGLAGRSARTILDDSRIRARKRLFFTATPTIYPAHEIVRVAEKNMRVFSMSDERQFGRVAHRLSFAEAIDRELLCPYQVVVMPVTDREVQHLIEKHSPVTTDGGDTRIDAYSLATQIACLRAMRDYHCRRMVAFHPRIDRSQAFSKQFNQAVELLADHERPEGPVWAAHIDGDRMPRSKRNQLLASFSQRDDVYRLLSNVKVLSEGVDIPGIDAVTLIDTKRGPAQVIQIVGRAVRKLPGKTVGTIVLPVLIGSGENPNTALARSEHAPMMELLRALRAADPDLERSVDDLRIEIDPNTGEPPVRRRFILNIPVEVGSEFADAVNVMLLDALAPGLRERQRDQDSETSSEAPQGYAIAFDPPDDSVNPLLDGLGPLSHAVGPAGLLGHVPRQSSWYGSAYSLEAWWSRVLKKWKSLDDEIKQEIADSVTWLSVEAIRHPLAREQMRELTTLTLSRHIDAWVCDFDSSAPEDLQLLAEADYIGPRSHLNTASLCSAFEGPNINAEDSTRTVLKALLIAGDECKRRARAKYFAQGFTEALTTLGPCRSSTPPATPLEREAMGQFAAGWQTAEPFFAEARLARGHEHVPLASRNKRRHRRPKGARKDRSPTGSGSTGGPRKPTDKTRIQVL
jgi:superfamily II DNA or RNA helicase